MYSSGIHINNKFNVKNENCVFFLLHSQTVILLFFFHIFYSTIFHAESDKPSRTVPVNVDFSAFIDPTSVRFFHKKTLQKTAAKGAVSHPEATHHLLTPSEFSIVILWHAIIFDCSTNPFLLLSTGKERKEDCLVCEKFFPQFRNLPEDCGAKYSSTLGRVNRFYTNRFALISLLRVGFDSNIFWIRVFEFFGSSVSGLGTSDFSKENRCL